MQIATEQISKIGIIISPDMREENFQLSGSRIVCS